MLFTKGNTDWYFGHKVHRIVDAVHGVPLAQFVTAANVSDMNTIIPLVERAEKLQDWLTISVLLADKGYDSDANYIYVDQRGTAPVIAIRRMPRDGIYTDDGVPSCMGMVPMEYVHSDPAKAHLYRCRAEGCHLADSKTGGIRHCDTEVWEDPTRNIRWFGGSVRRAARHGESCTVNDEPLSGSSSL